MNKILKILIGLIFLVTPIVAWVYDYSGFGTSALEFLKGGLMWMVLMIGLATLFIGISDLKN